MLENTFVGTARSWKPHKWKEHNFLHRNYIPKFFPTPKKSWKKSIDRKKKRFFFDEKFFAKNPTKNWKFQIFEKICFLKNNFWFLVGGFKNAVGVIKNAVAVGLRRFLWPPRPLRRFWNLPGRPTAFFLWSPRPDMPQKRKDLCI